jgi:hypothetical protein
MRSGRVAACPELKSKNAVKIAALITREAHRNGIIRLTFTA